MTSIQQFVSAITACCPMPLQAYGLGDQINNDGSDQQGSRGGRRPAPRRSPTRCPIRTGRSSPRPSTSAPPAPARRRPRNRSRRRPATMSSSSSKRNEGQTDPGVQLALYFQRVAPTVTNGYGILGDQNLLEVVQTIFGLASTSTTSRDRRRGRRRQQAGADVRPPEPEEAAAARRALHRQLRRQIRARFRQFGIARGDLGQYAHGHRRGVQHSDRRSSIPTDPIWRAPTRPT